MRNMGDWHRGNTVVNRIVREGLTMQVTFKQKHKETEDKLGRYRVKNRKQQMQRSGSMRMVSN